MQKWKHAVNTRTLLNQVLSSDKYNCIEADVTWNTNFNKPVIQITSRKFNNFIKNYDYFFRRKFNLDKIYLEEKSENRIKKIIKQNLKKKLPKKNII